MPILHMYSNSVVSQVVDSHDWGYNVLSKLVKYQNLPYYFVVGITFVRWYCVLIRSFVQVKHGDNCSCSKEKRQPEWCRASVKSKRVFTKLSVTKSGNLFDATESRHLGYKWSLKGNAMTTSTGWVKSSSWNGVLTDWWVDVTFKNL